MPVFEYKAIAKGQPVRTGTVTADTPRQAREMLRVKGLTIESIICRKTINITGFLSHASNKKYTTQMVSFVRELATLLGVGVPMLEAIDTIAGQHHGQFRAILLVIRDKVSSGLSLAQAMKEHPVVFDDLCVSITEVGENSGTLESALQRLAHFKGDSLQFKNKVISALIYPMIVLFAGMIVSVFLMTFVVPNLLETLLESGRELPFATKVIQAISHGLLHWWWLLLGVGLLAVMLMSMVLKAERGREIKDRMLLKLPLIGDILRKQEISRMSQVICTLLSNGIVFVRAIQIAQNTTGNIILKKALLTCEEAVYAGRDIAESLKDTGAFPPMVIQIFAAGQQSGRLEEMLGRLAQDYDLQVGIAAQRLTAVLEPVLILLLAVIVGFIAFATFMPIVEAGNVL